MPISLSVGQLPNYYTTSDLLLKTTTGRLCQGIDDTALLSSRSMTYSAQLTAENRLPDCVFMKLHRSPAKVSAGFKQTEVSQTELKLTIRFYRQRIKFPGGQVEFGLKRGELRVKLMNGKLPIERTGLTTPFELEQDIEVQKERGREWEGNAALTGGVKAKDVTKTSEKAVTRIDRVATFGTEENPGWVFVMNPYLLGQLTEADLGTIDVDGHPCCVEAIFLVQNQKDIHLFDSAGLLGAKNLSRNKTAVLTREFFLRFIAPRLQPYLSRVEGQL